MGIEMEPQDQMPSIQKRPIRVRRWVLGTSLGTIVTLGVAGYYADTHPVQTSEFLRATIGNKKTVELEGWVFRIKDERDKLKWKLFGGDEVPFDNNSIQVYNQQPIEPETPVFLDIQHYDIPSVILPEMPKPKLLKLPDTHLLQAEAAEGEGSWTISGLPHTTAENTLMAKTFIRPDTERPYASVGVLLLDKRWVRLNMVSGTIQPGNGPGKIPESDLTNLLVAFNGGFQWVDGYYGMYANGTEYKPLRNGVASVVVMKDGTIKMGAWGTGELAERTDEMIAIRQNSKLLVENGKLTADVENNDSDNDTWGYIDKQSRAFITWRSAFGLDAEGNPMIAVGNSLSAKTLAKAMQAAGAVSAMQLDINSPHSTIITYDKKEDGTLVPSLFMDSMKGTGRDTNRFFKIQERDFMYITLNETPFKP